MKESFNNDFNLYKNYLKSFGFYDVFENYLKLKVKNRLLNLTHEPLDCQNNIMNLFGHIHRLQVVKTFGLNVGIDGHNYNLLNENDIEFYLNAIENHYDKNVFCTKNDVKLSIQQLLRKAAGKTGMYLHLHLPPLWGLDKIMQ